MGGIKNSSKPKEGLLDSRLLNNKNFRKEQLKVFLLTVTLYATWHASRTAWAYSKRGIKDANPYFNDTKLGTFDMCFMLAYAFGQFYNGWLGDQSNLKNFLGMGSVISIVGYFAFAILARTQLFSMVLFSICFIVFGFGQSRGFPASTAILGNWIEASRRGILLGVWNAASDNIGNIIGQQIGRLIIDVNHEHWSNAIFFTGGTIIIATLILMAYLKPHPDEAGLEVETEQLNKREPSDKMKRDDGTRQNEVDEEELSHTAEGRQGLSEGISFWEAWKTPGIIKYSLVFACIKGSTYGLLFWLPDYLHSVMGFGAETATITATYEIGQFFGAVGLGYITDRLGKRSVALVVALYTSAVLFAFLAMLGPGSSFYSFALILLLAGICFGGPSVIVGGVVSSDLGENASLKQDKRSVSTMAGIINGCGSIAAAIVQVIIPSLKSASFYLYFGLCLTAAILLTQSAIRDIRNRKVLSSLSTVPEETEMENKN